MTARRFVVAAALAAATAAVAAAPGSASAHTLASSSLRIELSADDMSGSLTVAVASLDLALDAANRSDVLSDDEYAAQAIGYLQTHLVVEGADGTEWPEQITNVERQTVEGIETFAVELDFDVVGDDPSAFTITYDGIIEAVPEHEAVLVFVDATNRASTPGVFRQDDTTITIGHDTPATGLADMVRYGFHHVLEGADHLLFVLALVLPAPLMASAGRWRRGDGLGASLRRVTHVVTAFTLGHSLTLVATSLGWITFPSRPIEILIALSVAVSAVHAIRPLARRGEPAIAAGFGLVHGMAFAGILTELGLDGTTSIAALAAFNVGIELAQLAAIACVFPSVYLVTSRRSAGAFRVVGASIALAAAIGWLVDRTGLAGNPFAGVEAQVVAHPLLVAVGIAAVAAVIRLVDRPVAPITLGRADLRDGDADLVGRVALRAPGTEPLIVPAEPAGR